MRRNLAIDIQKDDTEIAILYTRTDCCVKIVSSEIEQSIDKAQTLALIQHDIILSVVRQVGSRWSAKPP